MPAETVADPETISAFGRVTSPVGSVHAPGDASTAVIELEAIKTMTQTIALMDLPAFMEFSLLPTATSAVLCVGSSAATWHQPFAEQFYLGAVRHLRHRP